ncbi:MAG: aspartate--tRNA ligase [Clostridiales bacterium]|nr:aspartate--tRNA ligase [Clostridiales bacterium]
MDKLGNLKRTDYCGQLRRADCERQVVLFGFAHRQRDLGNLIFIDLRDRTGIVQLSFNDKTPKSVFEKAQGVRGEYVLAAIGRVTERESKNADLPTGDIEVAVSELRILSKAQTPPFEISKAMSVGEETALKYRYLALRNPQLTQNIITRHELAAASRQYFTDNGFIEIETPMLIKSTPEGARDYVVPSRLHPGSFYALPQSPQIYKQLLMIAGFDRYFQLARCFRDEDLRADRQPEFTQIDLEASFVNIDELIEIEEGYIKYVMNRVLSVNIDSPVPRLTYKDAMEKYGTDKPDTRFEMTIENISDWAQKTDFAVFCDAVSSGGSVRAVVAKGGAAAFSRKKIDKLTEFVKGIGAKGLAYVRLADGAAACSFSKFLKDGELDELITLLGAKDGDCIFIVSGKNSTVLPVLGALRCEIAKRLDIIPKNKWNFVFITEMPFFEFNEDSGEWVAAHHPFTMPMQECIDKLDSDKGAVRAEAFDLVLNGVELSSGSMRITDCELQRKMFEELGMADEEIDAKFGFLVEAYKYAAPPHGGMGIGLDRLAMLMCGADSLRDVTAFPKLQNASEAMSSAPSEIDKAQLDELHISLTGEKI